jgi:hypothetical protein
METAYQRRDCIHGRQATTHSCRPHLQIQHRKADCHHAEFRAALEVTTRALTCEVMDRDAAGAMIAPPSTLFAPIWIG